MTDLVLPFSAAANDPGVAFEIDSLGGGIAIQGKQDGFDEQGQAGIGVWGWCDGGTAVVGEAVGLDLDGAAIGVSGVGPIGVQGTADNTAGGHGSVTPDETFGVMATNDMGTALFAKGSPAASFIGDVSQSRANGGCVKALAYLSTGGLGSVRVLKRFFQSQKGIAAPKVYRLDTGIYSIDFNFEVIDRYVTVTTFGTNFSFIGGTDGVNGVENQNPFAPLWYPPPAPSPWGVQYVIATVVFDGLTHSPDSTLGDPGLRKPDPTKITVMTYKPSLMSTGPGGFVLAGFSLADADFSVAIY